VLHYVVLLRDMYSRADAAASNIKRAASHIVSARSTLTDLVLLIGDLKRCAYLPACKGHEEERSAGGVCYMMDGYTAQGTWDNSATQRQAMLAYEGVREGRTWGSGC